MELHFANSEAQSREERYDGDHSGMSAAPEGDRGASGGGSRQAAENSDYHMEGPLPGLSNRKFPEL